MVDHLLTKKESVSRIQKPCESGRATTPSVPVQDGFDRLKQAQEENAELSVQLETALKEVSIITLEREILEIEFNQLFNSTNDYIWLININYEIERVNSPLANLVARPKDTLIGKKCHEIMGLSVCQTQQCPLVRINNGEKDTEHDTEIHTGNIRIPVIQTATAFRGFGQELIGIYERFKDITHLKKAESDLKIANSKLRRLTKIDGLTQISNRRGFDEYLNNEWKRGRREKAPLSLLLCDIDYFKQYNDTYGHQKGDECLQMIAKALTKCVKRPADLVARYGGEEFALILPSTPAGGAIKIAQSIVAAVRALELEHTESTVSEFVTISIGVTCFIPDDQPEHQLIEAADQALYEAKDCGRNTVITSIGSGADVWADPKCESES